MLMGAEQTEEEKAMDTTIAELAEEGGKCVIYRKREMDSAYSYIDTVVPAGAVTLEYLKQKWGGGLFRLQFRNAENQFHKSLNIQIASEFKSLAEVEASKNGVGEAAAIIKEIKAGEDKTLPLMMQMMQSQAAQQMQMMQAMMQSQAQMIAAVVGRPLPTPPAIPEMLLAKLLERNNPMEQIEILSKMKQVFNSDKDDEPGESSVMEKVLSAAPMFFQALAGGGANGRAALPSSTPRPVVSPEVGPASRTPPASPEGRAVHTGQLSPALKQLLVEAALSDAEVELYYDVILDKLGNDDEHIAALVGILKEEHGLAFVIGDVPKETQAWFVKLKEMLVTWQPEVKAAEAVKTI